MARSRRPLKAALLAATLSTACASWIPAAALFEREASCVSGYSQCPQSGLPDGFCCPTGHTCIPLAANTTVVCCPANSDCSLINPITCDLSQEDPEKHANALIKTTALDGRLGHCGDGTCCPYGYSCNQDSQCAKDTSQNASPIQSTPTSTSTSTSAGSAASSAASGTATASRSTASTAGPAATVVPAPAETTTAAPTSALAPAPTGGGDSGNGDKSGPSTGVIAGSVVGGIAAAALLGVLACVLARRRRRRQGRDRDDTDPLKLGRSTSSFGNIVSNPLTARGGPVISKPIVSGNSTMRSDFGRKTASPQSTPDSRRDSAFGARFGRPSSHDMSVSPPSTPPSRGGAAAAANAPPRIPPIRTMRQSSVAYGYPTYAETPRPHEATRVEREPSSLSINIFADPRTVNGGRDPGAADRQSSLTTFTEMMERADLGGIRRGEPYVPPSAMNSPAARRR